MALWLTTVPGQMGPGPPGADVRSPGSRPGLGPQREHHSGRRPVGDKLGGKPCPRGSVLCSDSPCPCGQSSCHPHLSGDQVPESQACCLSRQAILPGLTFPLMSFCKGIK